MQYRVDSPVSWLDWALRNTQNQPGNGAGGVDLSQIEFAVIDGAVQYRQGGPDQPWTVIVRLADIQDGSGATLDDIRAALETAVNSVAVDRGQIVADVTPTFRVISTGLQYKLPADDDWTTIASMPVIKGRPPTAAEIQAAVSDYLEANPPAPGADGQGVTEEQVAAAVAAYLEANPPARGEDGTDASAEQIAAAVASYFQDHPELKGDPGQDGEDGAPADMSRVSALETTIGSLTGTAATLATRTSALETAVGAVTGDAARITTLETRYAALTGVDGAYSSRITALETNQTAITGTAAGIASRTAVLETRANSITGDAATLTARVTALETRTSAITGTNADQDTRITVLETRLAAVSGIAGTKPTVTLSVGYGTASLNALVLGGTQTVTVTLDQAMPTSAYTVKCRASAGVTVLSMLTFAVLARTTTTVQIRAAATGVASVAAVLHVNAYQTVVT